MGVALYWKDANEHADTRRTFYEQIQKWHDEWEQHAKAWWQQQQQQDLMGTQATGPVVAPGYAHPNFSVAPWENHQHPQQQMVQRVQQQWQQQQQQQQQQQLQPGALEHEGARSEEATWSTKEQEHYQYQMSKQMEMDCIAKEIELEKAKAEVQRAANGQKVPWSSSTLR
jgi:hypothetical protein